MRPQTNPQGRNSCVPACVSMVLASQGVDLSEETLCEMLETRSAGTEVWNLLLLSQEVTGCRVDLGSASFERLHEALTGDMPPIAFIATGRLSYWHQDTLHAVVVVDVTDAEVRINDPTFADAVRNVPRDEFMAAWSEVDFLMAIMAVGPAAQR